MLIIAVYSVCHGTETVIPFTSRNSRGGNSRPLVAIEKRLRLRDMEGISSRHIKDVTLPIIENVFWVIDSRFKCCPIAYAQSASIPLDGFMVEKLYVLHRQECGFAHWASFLNRSS
jgi:hypothetical protein